MAKKKNSSDKKAKKLKKDLKNISEDWESLKEEKAHHYDEIFLDRLASDIITLNDDAHALEEDEEWSDTAHTVTHLLGTPWGAPFVSNLTLLDAALSYQSQDPEESDLGHMMEDFSRYGHQFENQLFKLFEDILDDFEYHTF